ncbi:beta-ketoacyl reductase, partial [Actinomadura fulvescens]
LDLFMLYSSITSLGQIGQSSYVAANLFLEALARRRRSAGLPALAVCLAPLTGTDTLNQGGRQEMMVRLGIEPIRQSEALTAIETMLAAGSEGGAVGRCVWGRLCQVLPSLRAPKFSLVLPPGTGDPGTDRRQLTEVLATMSSEQAHHHLAEEITRLLSGVLLVPADQISPDRRLDEYGLDSLMAAELLTSLQARFAVDIPPMELLRGGTVTNIAHSVLRRLAPQKTQAPGPDTAPRAADVPAPRQADQQEPRRAAEPTAAPTDRDHGGVQTQGATW